MAMDPEYIFFQKDNLIEHPEHQDLIRELAGDIYDWLESSGGMQIPLKRTIKHRWGDYRHSGQD